MSLRSTDVSLTDKDRDLLRRRESHGWFVLKVFASDSEPAFAYSLGLYESFSHPELIMFGLDLDTMHKIVNDAGKLIKTGHRFENGQESWDLLEGHPCAFRLVRKDEYSNYLTYTEWFYGGSNFPALQLVWPDTSSRFPWETGFDERYRRDQPRLYAHVS